jgi:16S rRNA processing protein RimM
MISPKEIIQVGRTQKPYGIKGEINILFNSDEYAELDSEYYFLMIENIPVPFFIEDFTFTTDVAARVKFEDINDEKVASKYINLEVYLPRDLVKETEYDSASNWNYFIGYKIVRVDGEFIGKISSVDESTINTLFLLHNGEKEIMIPATEDFITAIDEEGKIIEMNLPEGLLDE